ncbi:MAG: TRAP transporter large permease [Oscillibacter sp.]|nr:TRAP transporter large permease [Oscillibacter sp.]
MSLNFIWLFVMLFIMMALNIPVATSMLISSVVYMLVYDIPIFSASIQSIWSPMSSVLLSTGFFILAGNLMNNGGVTKRIFHFANTMVGWIPGGLAHSNVLASVIFAGMSGTAIGDAGGLGQIEVQAMTDNGYDLDFSLAVTGASSILGPIIPPSVPMVMYSLVGGVSIGRMFMAGIIPGIISAVGMMALCYVISIKRKYAKLKFPTLKEVWSSFRYAFFPLMAPVIILASIYSGVITPSESAVIAAVYAIVIGLFSKDLGIKELPKIFKESFQLFGSVLYIYIASKFFGFVVTYEQVPNALANLVRNSIGNSSPFLFFLAVIAILLVCGCIMDNNATILIIAPVLAPLASSFGIDPVHFGLVFIFTMMIGVVTPPVGIILFVLQGMSGISFGKLCRAITPFIILIIGCAILFALVPELSTWLPNLVFG